MSVKCSAGDLPFLEISDSQLVDYGVLKGSCLGPLLFLIYNNDLSLNLENSKSILFADDTTLYKCHSNLRYLKWSLQHDLELLMDWFKVNKLTLNLGKSVCMLFNEKIPIKDFTLEVESCVLPRVSCTKFLGVWIDSKLSWERHIAKLILKIKHNKHLLRCGKNFLSLHARKLIYFAHIQSHLTYCLSVWGNLICNTLIGKLQKEQSNCLELVKCKYPHKALAVLSVCDLIKLENVKFGYKVMNNLLPYKIKSCTYTDVKGCSLEKTHRYNTHQKDTPNLPRAKTSKYLMSVFCQGIKLYNELPYKTRMKKSLSSFCSTCKMSYLSNCI